MKDLLRDASLHAMLRLEVVEKMTMGCLLATDSGKRQLYVIGYLDNGSVFTEKINANTTNWRQI